MKGLNDSNIAPKNKNATRKTERKLLTPQKIKTKLIFKFSK
jgi:hypothetical protein